MKMKRAYNGNDRAKKIAVRLWQENPKITYRALADKLIDLGYVETISHVTCKNWIDEFKTLQH